MSTPIPVTVCEGEGIGPEVVEAALRVLEEAGAPLAVDWVPTDQAAAAAQHSGALLCGPLAPEAGASLRRDLGMVAETRRARAPAPFVHGSSAGLDLTVVRALESAGRPEVAEAVARAAERACDAHGRRAVTLVSGAGGEDAALHQAVAARLEGRATLDRRPADAATAAIVTRPRALEMLVVPALHGAVVAGVAARLAGGLPLASCVLSGRGGEVFAPGHGPAPALAGEDMANPSGMILASVALLAHLGLPAEAARVHDAWARTIEDGIHTPDIHHQGTSWRRVGTTGFTNAVVARLGLKPMRLPALAPAQRLVQAAE